MESKADNILKGSCHSCDFRHSCCPHWTPDDKPCKHWKLGKCYTCKFLDDTDEAWFKRGCESECFSGCNKYKRDFRKTLEIIKKFIKKEF